MPTLHIDHAISDLTVWREAFDPLQEVRRQAGVLHEVVRQPVGEPHRIVVDLEFDTVENAQKFLEFLTKDIWATPANAPALVGSPTAVILETVLADDVRDRSVDPLDLVKQIYAGFEVGDPSIALEHFSEQATIEQDPRLPWGGRYTGRDGALEFMSKLVATVDTRLVIDTIFQAGDDIIQVGRSVGTLRDSGVPIDVAECHVWTIRNSVIDGVRFYIDSEAVLKALD